MNPSEKDNKVQGAETKSGSAPQPGAADEPATTEAAQANRLTGETLKLLAEANEVCARQLQELKRIGGWLQRDLTAETGRLAQLDKDLRERETVVQQAEKLHREGVELKRQAETQAQENRRTLQEAQRLREEAEKVQAQLLPKALQGEPWRAWREEVIRRAATEGPVSLLVARLHTAAALERSNRPLTMELLRDIGRSVYETYSSQAEKIAQALTQTARGQFDLKTVRVGDRVDNKFMKPSASGLVEVRAVSGWAVRDAKGSWQFLAEVS
jgi:DNA repair exonuclease SbcCD ATPase subunit